MLVFLTMRIQFVTLHQMWLRVLIAVSIRCVLQCSSFQLYEGCGHLVSGLIVDARVKRVILTLLTLNSISSLVMIFVTRRLILLLLQWHS